MILCEDTRVTKKLLHLLSRDAFISANFPKLSQTKRIFSLHSHNEEDFLQDGVFAKLQIDFKSQNVVYMSDAGMPCVSDPGARLIEYAQSRGIEYDVLAGGSAVVLAYAMSGNTDDGFLFGGFLPHKEAQRRKCLSECFEHLECKNVSIIFYESPHRILESLKDLVFVDAQCKVFAIKEMTKMNQKFFKGSALEVLAMLEHQNTQGEWVLVLKPSIKAREVLSLFEIKQMDLPPKIKVKLISKITKEDPKALYQQLICDTSKKNKGQAE